MREWLERACGRDREGKSGIARAAGCLDGLDRRVVTD
jgi:hypothetical protein